MSFSILKATLPVSSCAVGTLLASVMLVRAHSPEHPHFCQKCRYREREHILATSFRRLRDALVRRRPLFRKPRPQAWVIPLPVRQRHRVYQPLESRPMTGLCRSVTKGGFPTLYNSAFAHNCVSVLRRIHGFLSSYKKSPFFPKLCEEECWCPWFAW